MVRLSMVPLSTGNETSCDGRVSSGVGTAKSGSVAVVYDLVRLWYCEAQSRYSSVQWRKGDVGLNLML